MGANWANRTLFHGDNLDVMRAMNSESVDLIATDPPFNKSKDFHATPDSLAAGASFQDRWTWERDVHPEWIDQLKNDYPELMEAIESAQHAHSDGMGAYMCFMAVRLLEMRRVLNKGGSIYLHCDPTASHYLKAVMDAIFGWQNFRNEINWRRNESGAKGSQHSSKRWGNNVDHLLFYAKGKESRFEPRIIRDLTEADIIRMFPKTDENGQRYNTKMTAWCSPSMGARPNLCYEFQGHYPPYPSGWRLGPKRMEEEYQKGNIAVLDDKLERRSYAKDYMGVSPGNLWTEAELLLAAQSSERTGYPTQKPVALYERLIKASSDEGDIVFDPFAGCATTCVAAEKLKRQWIGIDIWNKASEVIIERLNKERLFAPRRTRRTKENLQTFLFAEDFHFTDNLPIRTDDGEPAAPFLRVKEVAPEPKDRKMSRQEMMDFLLKQSGIRCEGCFRTFDDPLYLELDHNTPRKDGGWNHISNRILLCSPCNRIKAHRFTLSGLREENRKRGRMRG